jgi:hypothetical protein
MTKSLVRSRQSAEKCSFWFVLLCESRRSVALVLFRCWLACLVGASRSLSKGLLIFVYDRGIGPCKRDVVGCRRMALIWGSGGGVRWWCHGRRGGEAEPLVVLLRESTMMLGIGIQRRTGHVNRRRNGRVENRNRSPIQLGVCRDLNVSCRWTGGKGGQDDR